MTVTEVPPKKRVPRDKETRPFHQRLRMGGLGVPVALVLVICLLAQGATSWADRRNENSPAANRVLLDKAATDKAVAEVSSAITRILTYTYTDPAATQRAADRLLTGKAHTQYRQLFGQVIQLAPAQKLALTTRVVKAGAIKLTGDTAVVLVFLDQDTTRAGRKSGSTATAQLVVTARNSGGWRISDLAAA
ncbi:hypothetical protein SMC26_04745 [Actinomadura fulvescens]|uniref:Mce-associated membrane protein n=1 Tax=Actinomadura fulvescens TaxID=46160 RepID=A0ABP6C235_9ACTN